MSAPESSLPHAPPLARLARIEQARQAVLHARHAPPNGAITPWIERSWQRCLAVGLQPGQRVGFDVLTSAQMRRTAEANAALVQTARPVLDKLGRAIVNTHYFAILTNAQGVVVDVSGAIDRSDPRADLITRVGVDLSERSVGTTAIGAVLHELQPVWLHRGEHFFSDTSVYSCAGAPVFGPDGQCAGMLDLTGINAVERPELKHLVTQSANKIENALVLAQPHVLTVRLNWPGNQMGSDADGLLCLDTDGWITGANRAARDMVPNLGGTSGHGVHVSEVFGIAHQTLFDAVRHFDPRLEIPLWTGLRLQALPIARACESELLAIDRRRGATAPLPLKDVETALIRKAVRDAKGNVTEAARALGISRATVYRKLGQKKAD
jgi:transcriptional regulator of acetoin/glycerol metabolism